MDNHDIRFSILIHLDDHDLYHMCLVDKLNYNILRSKIYWVTKLNDKNLLNPTLQYKTLTEWYCHYKKEIKLKNSVDYCMTYINDSFEPSAIQFSCQRLNVINIFNVKNVNIIKLTTCYNQFLINKLDGYVEGPFPICFIAKEKNQYRVDIIFDNEYVYSTLIDYDDIRLIFYKLLECGVDPITIFGDDDSDDYYYDNDNNSNNDDNLN